MSAPVFRLHGYIGDGRNTSSALAGFLAMHAGQAVDIVVNSPGGDALEGSAILAEMEAHGRVRCIGGLGGRGQWRGPCGGRRRMSSNASVMRGSR